MDQSEIKRKAASADVMAEIYGISAGTLANYRSKKIGPKFYKVGRKVLYRFDDFESWLFSNPVMTIDAHYERIRCKRSA